MNGGNGRIVVVGSLCLGVLLSLRPPFALASSTPTADGNPCVRVVTCGAGDSDTFTFGSTNGSAGAGNDNGTSVSFHGPTTATYYDYAPACSQNDRLGDTLCGAAVSICPDPDIAYWEWTKVVDRASGVTLTDWTRQSSSVCIGPSDPRLSPTLAIQGFVTTEFKRLMILKGDVHAQPDGNTLVNYDTGFYSTTRNVVLPEFPLLGMTIRVTGHPQSYDWDFGDGTVLRDAGPGAKDGLDVAHTYRRTGGVTVSLTVTWTGTFTVDGGPPRDVFGTAQTTSLPSPLRVKQARAELVTR